MSNKLYVLVRKDLSHGQQMSQAIHAVADFMLYDNETHLGYGRVEKLWQNDTIVVLGVKDERELLEFQDIFYRLKISHSSFKEPDMNYEHTAIAAHGAELAVLLKKLNLA